MIKSIQIQFIIASLRGLLQSGFSLSKGIRVVSLTTLFFMVLTPGLAVARPGQGVQLISPSDGNSVLTKRPLLDWSKVGKAQSTISRSIYLLTLATPLLMIALS